MNSLRAVLVVVAITAGLQAGSLPDYTEALKLIGAGNYDGAGQQLHRIVDADPGFARAWWALVEAYQKQNRAAELKVWLAGSANPGACIGRMELLGVEKAPEGAFENEARVCASRLPESFSVYREWIRQTSEGRATILTSQFAGRAQESVALQFAAGLAPNQSDANRAQLEAIDGSGLNPHNRNDLDDALFFLYPSSDPRRTDAARRLLERAQAAGDLEWVNRAGGRLAIIAHDQRRYADCLQYARNAHDGAQPLGRPTSFSELMAGECLFRLGRTDEAIETFQASLASALREGDPERQASSLEWLASQNNESGHFTAAIGYALRAIEVAKEAKLNAIGAHSYALLAFAWLALGQGPRALEAAHEAESTWAPLSAKDASADVRDDVANLFDDIANIYLQLGQPTQALTAVERSFSADPSNAVRQAEAHLLRAEALVALRRPAEARQDLETAASLAPEISSYRARGQLTAGRIALDQSRYDTASAAFAQALEAAAGFPVLLAKAHAGMSDVYWRQGRLADALAERQRAIEVVERMRSSLAAGHRAGYLAARIQLYRDSAQLLLQLNRVDEAFNLAEQGRARELLDLTATTSQDRAPAAHTESTDLQNLRAATTTADNARSVAERRKADLELQAATDRYLISVAGAAVPSAASLTLAQIQSRLGPNAAVLHYSLNEPRSSLFVVTRARVRHFGLSAQSILNAQVRQTRDLLATPPERLRQAELVRDLRHLYELLIAPAASELRGIHELIIVADGVLHTLPFEALVEPGESAADLPAVPFLLRRYVVRYAPSASLGAAPPSVPATGILLAYGDPRAMGEAAATITTAVERTNGSFGRLPFSRQEVEQIAALYPIGQRHVALAGQATESAIKKDPSLPDASIVHLAVHGFVDDRWPQMSGLVLPQPTAAAEGQGDDGMLRIYEILALRLKAELVVLSACDSASGTEITGEGLASLRRAFLAAGARSIVASLWRVNDRAAANLMVGFHRQLIARRQPGEALRAAQLEMLSSGAYSHPYYWSVFTLMSRGQ